ncbi:MAG: aspartate/glutamate racemase family protein [Bacillota bacterium]
MRIVVVGSNDRAEYLQEHASPGVEVIARPPEGGPSTIESMVDEYEYIPGVLEVIQWAEEEGFDAVVTGCFGDPGIDAARELVHIPVVAPGETSMLIAAMLGHSFSIVTPLESVVRPLKKLAQAVGVSGKMVSVRVVGVPIEVIRRDHDRVLRRAIEVSRECVQEDDADVIVMGCGSMSFYATEIARAVGVPVINPMLTSLRVAEALVGAGLTHSKRAYPLPPKIGGYGEQI